MAARLTLVVGGQRSGKSRYAERMVSESGLSPVYVATATAGDAEMADRIARHRARRGADWALREEPVELPTALAETAAVGHAVLVDCLTLWTANLLGAERDIEAEGSRLIAVLTNAPGRIVIVSNEVGSGIIPANALARRFADALGTLNQEVAAVADEVVLMASGLPLMLKPAAR